MVESAQLFFQNTTEKKNTSSSNPGRLLRSVSLVCSEILGFDFETASMILKLAVEGTGAQESGAYRAWGLGPLELPSLNFDGAQETFAGSHIRGRVMADND